MHQNICHMKPKGCPVVEGKVDSVKKRKRKIIGYKNFRGRGRGKKEAIKLEIYLLIFGEPKFLCVTFYICIYTARRNTYMVYPNILLARSL